MSLSCLSLSSNTEQKLNFVLLNGDLNTEVVLILRWSNCEVLLWCPWKNLNKVLFSDQGKGSVDLNHRDIYDRTTVVALFWNEQKMHDKRSNRA